jgi:glucokinase
MEYKKDQRIVLTLDAGGTNFVFSAMQGCKSIVKPLSISANSDDLDHCLQTIVKGFKDVQCRLQEKAVANIFSFPGPAD